MTRPHATPRYARRTSGFRSSSSDVPLEPDAAVLEHVAAVGHGRARAAPAARRSASVMPSLLEPLERLERRLRRSSGASPVVGSSSISSRGRAISARPTASICCSPPLRVPACWRCRSCKPREEVVHELERRTDRAAGDTRPGRGCSSGSSPGTGAARPERTRSPRARSRWAGRRVRSFPSRTTRPAIGGSSPAIARKSVVLPAPFEPTIATASPVRDLDVDAVDDPLAEVPGRQPVDLKQRGPARGTRRRPAGPA